MRFIVFGVALALFGCAAGGGAANDADAGLGGSSGDATSSSADATPSSGDATPSFGDATRPASDAARPGPDAAGSGADAGAPATDAQVPPESGTPCGPCAVAHEALVAGLHRIHFALNMTRVDADSARYAPIVWGSAQATGGDRAGLPGTLPAPGWLGVRGEGRIVVWAGHEGAFGGDGDGTDDNDALRTRVMTWLLGAGSRVRLATGHAEWLRPEGFSPAVRAALEVGGATVGPLDGALDAASLSGVDALVLGNPWGDLGDDELDALTTWVEQGGGLLVLGLGWSWPTNDDPTGEDYPVRRLGARLGFSVPGGSISDPGAPAGSADTPAYAVRPLAEWTPLKIEVLRTAETDVSRVAELASANPDVVYVIEGEHMGLSVPREDWALLLDPVGALDAFDRLYEAELALVGGAHPPFRGDIVWMVGEDAPEAPWWMHSGNPIIFKVEAARTEIIDRLNTEGHPGWGIAHEQGHNMHQSCNDLFVPAIMGEVWPNVFGLYSYRQNGWDWTAQMGPDVFARGHAWHAQASPDPAELSNDPFILLGCLELIWSRYGWEGMQTFLTGASADAAEGQHNDDDAARLAYLVERLSLAYHVDLAPLFTHWGFDVTEQTRAATAGLPASDIGW